MASFANQTHDDPMIFALLEMVERQFNGFMSSQAAGNADVRAPVSGCAGAVPGSAGE
jgi:hypothetical protein